MLKGMLRFVGIEPPRQHDVGRLLLQRKDRFPHSVEAPADRLAEISHRLRKEREFAFFGDEDFIPAEEYTHEEAKEAIADARFAVRLLDAFPVPQSAPRHATASSRAKGVDEER